MKRNELDLILTELLPVEVSAMYTHANFYEFLLNNESAINTIEKKLKKNKYSSTTIFDKEWHAMPFKYLVNKGNNELREISLLNPFSVLELLFFVKLYNEEILNNLSKKNMFSLRYHKKNRDLLYKSSVKGLVQYVDPIIKKNKFIKSLETTGVYYNLSPYTALGQFYNSKEWFKLNSQFKYFAKIDFQDCFGSIYTHSYKWTISSNAIDSRNYKNNNLYSVIDRVMQQVNGSITNGIVVGPEFSRMIAELLLQHIDYEVFNQLTEKKIVNGKDFKIYRYVDDIYIFTNEEKNIDQIIASYKNISLKYQLKLNESKTTIGKLPYVWNEWKTETKAYVKHLNEKCFYNYSTTEEYLIKGKNFIKDSTIASIKEDFQNLLSKYPEKKEKIVSYVYSAFFNQLKNHKKNSLFRQNINLKEIENVFDFVFYLYSFAPTFRNTRKLISIDYIFEKELSKEICKDILQKTIAEYEYIFHSSNIPDLVDLFLILGKKEIEISISVEEYIWKEILRSNNPILIANFLIYAQYNSGYYKSIKEQLEKKMLVELSVIVNSKDILLQKGLWWVIIFSSYPDLSSQLKKMIQEKIELLKPTREEPNSMVQNLLYSFLTSEQYINKFIEWDILDSDISEEITFYTYERTIFKKESIDLEFMSY